MKVIIIGTICVGIMSAGCSNKESEAYYKAMSGQREAYIKAYKAIKDENIKLDCESKCSMVYTKPKALPRFQAIRKPMTNGEAALRWFTALSPTVLGVSALYFNHKTSTAMSSDSKDIAIANVNADTKMFEAMAGSRGSNIPSTIDNSVSTTTTSSTTTDNNSDYSQVSTTSSTDNYSQTTDSSTSSADTIDNNSDYSTSTVDDNSVVSTYTDSYNDYNASN